MMVTSMVRRPCALPTAARPDGSVWANVSRQCVKEEDAAQLTTNASSRAGSNWISLKIVKILNIAEISRSADSLLSIRLCGDPQCHPSRMDEGLSCHTEWHTSAGEHYEY